MIVALVMWEIGGNVGNDQMLVANRRSLDAQELHFNGDIAGDNFEQMGSEFVADKICKNTSIEGMKDLLSERGTLFANTQIGLSLADLNAMKAQISAIGQVLQTPAYQSEVLSKVDQALRNSVRLTEGAMNAYDFHITPNGPKLIEINTNAGGGGLVNAMNEPSHAQRVERVIVDMFISEWNGAGRSGVPKTVAIIDREPQNQYLYPEFLLAAQMFSRMGIEAVIADPDDLIYQEGELCYQGVAINMVYNRLTDFSLVEDSNAVILRACLENNVVVTPNPLHHALSANKGNLVKISDPERWDAWGLSYDVKDVLAQLPKSVLVNSANADWCWERRKQLFFKPLSGFGSRAVYRGDKLTKRVWQMILSQEYIAQELVMPNTTMVKLVSGQVELKYDLRLYAFGKQVYLIGARLYSGQTTNFRTEGGGLAAVYSLEK